MKLNLNESQKKAIVDNPDDSMLPIPSLGWHTFTIVSVNAKNDDAYGEFESCELKCACLDEPDTRKMNLKFNNDEKSIVRLGNIYATLVLDKKYEGEDIDTDDLLGVDFRGEIQEFENDKKETMKFLSKYIQKAEMKIVTAKPAFTPTKEEPKVTLAPVNAAPAEEQAKVEATPVESVVEAPATPTAPPMAKKKLPTVTKAEPTAEEVKTADLSPEELDKLING